MSKGLDAGSVIGLIAGIIVTLGLGGFALIKSIWTLASSDVPDITAGGKQIGRTGLVVFLVLGLILVVVGIALIVALAKGV